MGTLFLVGASSRAGASSCNRLRPLRSQDGQRRLRAGRWGAGSDRRIQPRRETFAASTDERTSWRERLPNTDLARGTLWLQRWERRETPTQDGGPNYLLARPVALILDTELAVRHDIEVRRDGLERRIL